MRRFKAGSLVRNQPILIGPILVFALCLNLGCAGTSSVMDEPAELPRSDSDVLLRTLSCPGNQKPVCNKRMGVVENCYCSSSADFRKLHEVNLKNRYH